MCSCAAVALVPLQADGPEAENPELVALKAKIDACQIRFAKLVGILNQTIDPAVRKKVFDNLGREYARQYRDLTDKYTKDVKSFLDTGQSNGWRRRTWTKEPD